MDTHFAVHDTVPNNHTMADRVGTQGFEFGLAQTQDIRDAVLPCDETGQHYLIPFLWFDPMPSDTTMVRSIMNQFCHILLMLSIS